ncbi:hypothetical protein GQA70_12690 [Ponticoccus alexandrii]|uniref:Uncharacterized protein n=1 Tax=Ponticoccus alexandrii TaxID=1943633 RepID=A0ABX7FAE0_9RHOB|nr:hypothetical protein P279_20440 [Rhodobacteraceae bacterium PD-2]QRF67091.1 hypothetical protein GQA70_12690 [Ponticoccus alexandrii]
MMFLDKDTSCNQRLVQPSGRGKRILRQRRAPPVAQDQPDPHRKIEPRVHVHTVDPGQRNLFGDPARAPAQGAVVQCQPGASGPGEPQSAHSVASSTAATIEECACSHSRSDSAAIKAVMMICAARRPRLQAM